MNRSGSRFRAACFAVVLLFSSAVARAQLGTVVLDDEFTDGRVDTNQGAGGIGGGFAVARVDAGGRVRELSSFLILSQSGGGRVASVRSEDSFRFYHTNGVEVFWQLAQIQAPPTGVKIVLGVYRLDLPSGAAPVPDTNSTPSINLVLDITAAGSQAALVLTTNATNQVQKAVWRLATWNPAQPLAVWLRINGAGYAVNFDQPVSAPSGATASPLSGTWDDFFDGQWTKAAVVTAAGQGQRTAWTVNVDRIVVSSLGPPVTLALTEQPKSVTVPVGTSATFRVVAAVEGAPAGDLLYQWEKDGVEIAGATNTSYTTPPAANADSGAKYRCVVSVASSVEQVISQEATLTVVPPPSRFVLMRSFTFHPEKLVINPGEAVTWTNADVAVHTATSDDGLWKSPALSRGATFTFTFTNAGSFSYFSEPQKYMRGKIVVQSPPAVTILSPANKALLLAPTDVTIVAAATDSDGTVSQVEFFSGTNLLSAVSVGEFRFTLTNPPSGAYVLTARATDNRGAATVSKPVNVSVDVPPTIALTRPTEAVTLILPGTLLAEATASDSDGRVSRVEFFLSDAAKTNLVGSLTNAPFALTLANPLAGSYQLFAAVTDDLGATTVSAPVAVTVLARPRLGGLEYAAPGAFRFRVSGMSNRTYVVEAATNLIDPEWLPLSTNVSDGSEFTFADPNAVDFPRRFYRALDKPY